MKWNAIGIAIMLTVFGFLPMSVSAQTETTDETLTTEGPQHRSIGLGFHNVEAPLGGRWWFGSQKVGIDFGLGIRSTPAPQYDESLTGWVIDVGVPIVLKGWDRVHVLFRPGFFYDSQEVEMSDPPEPFATDERTSIGVTAELEAEVFLVHNFSVSASQGIGYFNVDPAGGGDGTSNWNTLGNNFAHIGFHVYFLGGGS